MGSRLPLWIMLLVFARAHAQKRGIGQPAKYAQETDMQLLSGIPWYYSWSLEVTLPLHHCPH